jgi:hypothetical protein
MKYIMRFNESVKEERYFLLSHEGAEDKYDCITGSDIKDKWDISNDVSNNLIRLYRRC